MTDVIRQRFALFVLFAATVGCAAQSQQNSEPRAAVAHLDERAYHQCPGSICGPESQMATWLFESAPIPEDRQDAYVGSRCFGTVCGALATTTPAWILQTPTQDCLASVCGRETIAAATTAPLRPQSAQARTASCTTSNE